MMLEVFSMRPVDWEEISDEKDALPYMASTRYLPANPLDLESVLANLWALVRHPVRILICWRWAFGDAGGGGLSKRVRLWLQIWRGPVLAKRLYELVDCRHIHAQFSDGAATTALVASQILGVPFSFTSHTSYDSSLLREKLLSAAFVASISEYDKRKLIAAAGGSISERIHIIHCGIPIEDWPFRGARPTHNPVRILSVGALIEKKGHDVLIDACALLKNAGLQFNCRIIGAGPLKKALENRIRENNLEDCVRLAGALPQKVVKRETAEADLFVLASKAAANGDTDGVPVALMEAMSLGIPVVSTELAGIPELIRHGSTGFLAGPGDFISLADVIRECLDEGVDRGQIAEHSRICIENHFNQIIESEKLADLITRNI